MLNALLGRKIGMTQVFESDGTVVPVTVIEAGPCVVTQIKTIERDGYEAVQIGFEEKPVRKATRPQLGHLGHHLPMLKAQRKRLQAYRAAQAPEADSDESKETSQSVEDAAEQETSTDETKAAAEQREKQTAKPDKQIQKLLKLQQNRQRRPGPVLGPYRFLREIDVENGVSSSQVTLGSLITAGLFQDDELVDITGISKGKGFQGVMKRHGFGGGPRTHGQSDRARAPGSIGSGTTPGRVLKGTRMAGHMGHAQVTIQGLRVVQVDGERNLLVVKGSVPGPNNGLLMIKKARTAKGARA